MLILLLLWTKANISQLDIFLPPHYRCASHTLNLIGSHDIDAALRENGLYKRLHNSAMAKCQALWNASTHPKAAEVVQEVCGKQLLVPCTTRWNSRYDAVPRLTELKQKLRELCVALSLHPFKDAEIEFLEEYVIVLRPLAAAIDILQGENNCYLGYLLPTLLIVKKSMRALINGSLVHAQSLASAIILGLQQRFGILFEMGMQPRSTFWHQLHTLTSRCIGCQMTRRSIAATCSLSQLSALLQRS